GDEPSLSGSSASVTTGTTERLAQDLATQPAVHDACTWAAHTLIPAFNPRQVKRLISLVHLYSLIALRLGYISANESDEELSVRLHPPKGLAAADERCPQVLELSRGAATGAP